MSGWLVAGNKGFEIMGRPKGSKNKPNVLGENDSSAAAQLPDNGVGHNSGSVELTEDQLQKRFFQHVREYKNELALKKECDDAKREQDASFKNLCKRIKGEGTPIEDIKTHLDLQSPEGEARMRASIDAQIRIARWNGLPLGTQTDLFSGVDRTPDVDKAYGDGKRDGLAAEPPSTKYAAGTAQYERYRDGYQAGQAVNLDGIKPLAPAADGDEQFDDATAEKPSRKRPAPDGESAGTYSVQ